MQNKKKVLILSGSPQKRGNTSVLVSHLAGAFHAKSHKVEVIDVCSLQSKVPGCCSCRSCPKKEDYGCVIQDDVSQVILKLMDADIIVMATPLYFFGPSAQTKIIIDRMFSLYKWDNSAGTMETPLTGKTLVLLASAFEDVGLKALEAPFSLIAEYTQMIFKSLIVPNAGVSGDLSDNEDVKKKVYSFSQALVF